ncbi:hypothetical protein [Saccharopolyspora griseoalba]|uniref:DUF2933 domain-containing protein n=1 Tax=Saccharopolyspora griseoalba TaxID=1431848 RepID=A0ABW2LES8_9PSEU
MEDAFYLIAVLACPAGMGIMMWFMMRGQHDGKDESTLAEQNRELAELRSEVESLRRQRDHDGARTVR